MVANEQFSAGHLQKSAYVFKVLSTSKKAYIIVGRKVNCFHRSNICGTNDSVFIH